MATSSAAAAVVEAAAAAAAATAAAAAADAAEKYAAAAAWTPATTAPDGRRLASCSSAPNERIAPSASAAATDATDAAGLAPRQRVAAVARGTTCGLPWESQHHPRSLHPRQTANLARRRSGLLAHTTAAPAPPLRRVPPARASHGQLFASGCRPRSCRSLSRRRLRPGGRVTRPRRIAPTLCRALHLRVEDPIWGN